MKLHHGVDLIRADSSDGLVEAYAAILPNHKPAIVIEISDDDWLEELYSRTEALDDDEVLRLDLLDHAATYVTDIDLTATRKQELPTNSLRRLPAYLRANAPG